MTDKTTKNLFTKIAREHLMIETLETRNRDSLDFHDVSVRGVERALRAAYDAGRAAERDAAKRKAKRATTPFKPGMRVCIPPLDEHARVIRVASDGLLLIVRLDSGPTAHVPSADCYPDDPTSKP
jgi:hypothetical protein